MLLIFLFILLIAFASIRIEKTYMNPITILYGIISIQVLSFHILKLFGFYFNDISNICFLYCLSLLGFGISYCICRLVFKPVKANIGCSIIKYTTTNDWLAHCIGALGFLWLLIYVINILTSGYSNFFMALRSAALDSESKSFGYGPHLLIFYQSFLAFKILSTSNIKKYVFLFLGAGLWTTFAKMEKITLFMTFTSLVSIFELKYMMYGNKIKIRYIITFVLLVLLIFILFPMIRDGAALSYSFVAFANYFTKSLIAFEQCIFEQIQFGDCKKVLGKIILRLLNLNIQRSYLTLGNYNVYTYIHGMYAFAGYYGVILISTLLGCWWAILFNFILRKNYLFCVFYCFYNSALVLSFFDYIFMMNNYVYYFCSIAMIYYITSKREYYKF